MLCDTSLHAVDNFAFASCSLDICSLCDSFRHWGIDARHLWFGPYLHPLGHLVGGRWCWRMGWIKVKNKE